MTERIARERMTFSEPFFVDGLGRKLPAGTYDIEIVEELIEGLSFLAYRVASTSILLPLRPGAPRSYEIARIDPNVVRAAKQTEDTSANEVE